MQEFSIDGIGVMYCKTLYFRCILISRFWNVEISLHFKLAFPSVLLLFTKPLIATEFLRVFNFAILSYSRNSRKFDAHQKYVFYSIQAVREFVCASVHAYWVLLTQYLEKYWTYFHQTFSTGAFWDKDECLKFWVKRSKFKVMVGFNVQENALVGLINAICW